MHAGDRSGCVARRIGEAPRHVLDARPLPMHFQIAGQITRNVDAIASPAATRGQEHEINIGISINQVKASCDIVMPRLTEIAVNCECTGKNTDVNAAVCNGPSKS